MPFQLQIRACRPDLGDFLQCFLQVVFAKCTLPGLGRGNDRIRAKGLGYRQQFDAVDIASGTVRGVGDPLTHSLQVLAYYRHNQSSSLQRKFRHQCSVTITSLRVQGDPLPGSPPGFVFLCRLRDYKWTFQNYSRSPSRIKHPICIYRPACHR
ncbi:hypothetical protein D3C81_1501850 [compost metagenome]